VGRNLQVHSGSNSDYERLLSEIRAQAAPIESLTLRLRSVIEKMDASSADSLKSGEYWKAVVFVDSLVRVGLFIEQNFIFIETMGVLAVCRYLFELTVWLKLLQQDARYGLVFYYQLLKQQCDFYAALQKHSEREILLLQDIERNGKLMLDRAIADVMQTAEKAEKGAAIARAMKEVDLKSDEEAARKFSIYAEGAQHNGYGFQAHLVRDASGSRASQSAGRG